MTTSRDLAEVLRYAAFTDDPAGGNPAGIVLNAGSLDDAERLRIASDIGYSETAFLVARTGSDSEYDVRYFSPQAEVPFCGHATIATAVALGERAGEGDHIFHIRGGSIPVSTARDEAGALTASLISLEPTVEEVSAADLATALRALNWSEPDLDPTLPPKIAYAGARHLILATRTSERLSQLDYAFDTLRDFMLSRDLTTIDLVHRVEDSLYEARNPFPVGGVYEDPATGAAAAAFGAYLRELGRVVTPARVTVLQGQHMGRPSRILVDIPTHGPITIRGTAVPIAVT